MPDTSTIIALLVGYYLIAGIISAGLSANAHIKSGEGLHLDCALKCFLQGFYLLPILVIDKAFGSGER
jgi:hypothetical protein